MMFVATAALKTTFAFLALDWTREIRTFARVEHSSSRLYPLYLCFAFPEHGGFGKLFLSSLFSGNWTRADGGGERV
jgi:hypothetical protein